MGQLVWFGQSIVGGLLGGLIGVEIVKVFIGQMCSIGDVMVLFIVVGFVIGCVGCFFVGLYDDIYGILILLFWGVDFGDGLLCYLIQFYEIVVVLLLGLVLYGVCFVMLGFVFKFFLSVYLLW